MRHNDSCFVVVIVRLFVLRGHRLHATAQQRDATDMGPPSSCLKLTTPDINLSYPVDAEAHFEELHDALRPFLSVKPHCAVGFCGPWIENYWVRDFKTKWEAEKQRAGKVNARLSNVFGPYIPILFTWVDAWVRKRMRYPKGFVEVLKKVIRPSVLYITVSQNAEGLTGKNEINMSDIPNVLVLSAGGYGHVPVPLFRQTENVSQTLITTRKNRACFVGSVSPTNEVCKIRHKMRQAMQILPRERFYCGKTTNWRAIMADSLINLAPRGFGRTSYHLVETIQMGYVPVQIYNDISWVPYAKLFERIGMRIRIESLPAFLHDIYSANATSSWITKLSEMEREILRIREHYFLPQGVMDRIAEFIQGRVEESGLVCQRLPETVRGDKCPGDK